MKHGERDKGRAAATFLFGSAARKAAGVCIVHPAADLSSLQTKRAATTAAQVGGA
jgi:hypothetical protein